MNFSEGNDGKMAKEQQQQQQEIILPLPTKLRKISERYKKGRRIVNMKAD
jgi:hypothetical protein